MRLFLLKGPSRVSIDQQRALNASNLKAALRKMEQRIGTEIERTGFFTGTLNISVQNGVIRTSKIGIEECEHFHVKA